MAEPMLMMCSWLKADHFHDLYGFMLRERVGWWLDWQREHSCASQNATP